MTIYDQYEPVIGLEIHLQLSTRSKAFCADDASFGGGPNTHISAISLGHPGTLPRLNEKQVEYAVRLGLALGCEINLTNCFDRKNYFYTDLPKGYQITQDRLPVCTGGAMEIRVNGERKNVRLHHIHMEEDAGKSIHDQDPSHSLIDLNRAGIPLLEIVTEPDLRTAEEVDAFMTAMRQLARYLEISDGNMQEGSMRCDVNVSVRKKGDTALGERCEIKNMNSMRYARQAIAFETKRQIDILEKGGTIVRETMNFDPATGTTLPMRDKESAHDYRYFPDPDLPPVVLSENWVAEISASLPALPNELFEKFTGEFQLSEYDAGLLTAERETAMFFLRLVSSDLTNFQNLSNLKDGKFFKAAANLIINRINPWLSETNSAINDFPVPSVRLIEFIQLIEEGKVSASIAYQRLFPALVESPGTSPVELAQLLHLIQSDDTDFLEKLVEDVLAANPGEVAAYQNGKKSLIGFFMGEVMKASRGKASPKAVNEMILKRLA